MRIAVSGATGRTAHPLVERALERDRDVAAFVRDARWLPSAVRADDLYVHGMPKVAEGR